MTDPASQSSDEAAPPAKNTPPVGRPFQKGMSGNPGGRPKGISSYVREKAGGDGRLLVDLLFTAIGGYLPEGTNADGSVKLVSVPIPERLTAVKLLLDRGWGKAPAYAPIESDDPLELGERAIEEFAAQMDASLDELAAKRKRRKAA